MFPSSRWPLDASWRMAPVKQIAFMIMRLVEGNIKAYIHSITFKAKITNQCETDFDSIS